jgi:hypothetical protein
VPSMLRPVCLCQCQLVPQHNNWQKLYQERSLAETMGTTLKAHRGKREYQPDKQQHQMAPVALLIQNSNLEWLWGKMGNPCASLLMPLVRCGSLILYLDTQYDVIKEVCKKVFGWRVVSQKDPWIPGADWDMAWTDVAPALQLFQKIKPHQRINHFPGMF